MSDSPLAYIAGIGMITAIGADAKMTAAAVKAGVNQFEASEYDNQARESITMAGVPEEVFETLSFEIDEGVYYSGLYDRVIKMAIVAAREACAGQSIEGDIPMVLAIPEAVEGINHITAESLVRNLALQPDLPIDANHVRCLHSGRAAGIEALDMAGRIMRDLDQDYVLVGASDSYWHLPLIAHLDAEQRVLAPGVMDGFVPGEGAGFLLLCRDADKALVEADHVIALYQPGLSAESGHLYSELPYRGDGLSEAFRLALNGHNAHSIPTIYASQNGEHFWAREYGVALLRNQPSFDAEVLLEHPADCYGDLGVATGPVLIGLCAQDLWQQPGPVTHLVYSSSDSAARAALRVEKQSAQSNNL